MTAPEMKSSDMLKQGDNGTRGKYETQQQTHTHHFTPTHMNTEGKKQDTKELKQCTWIDAYKIHREVK